MKEENAEGKSDKHARKSATSTDRDVTGEERGRSTTPAPVTRVDLKQQAAWKELWTWLLSDDPPSEENEGKPR